MSYRYAHSPNLFDELLSIEKNKLAYLSHFRTIRKGEIIELSPYEHRIFSLKFGILKIVDVDSSGQELSVDILRPGDLFGQFTMNGHNSDQYAVVLSYQVTYCSFTSAEFELILRRNPSLCIQYSQLIGQRLRRLENQYKNLMFSDVRTRLRLFLKEWIEKDAKPDKPFVVPNYLSHKDISQIICCNRQTVTELFNKFRLEGMLEYNRHQIVITDPSLLEV